MGAIVVSMAGLPGTGKSAIARAVGQHLSAPVLSKGEIEAALCRGDLTAEDGTGWAS